MLVSSKSPRYEALKRPLLQQVGSLEDAVVVEGPGIYSRGCLRRCAGTGRPVLELAGLRRGVCGVDRETGDLVEPRGRGAGRRGEHDREHYKSYANERAHFDLIEDP
jgi:hypothetical protein